MKLAKRRDLLVYLPAQSLSVILTVVLLTVVFPIVGLCVEVSVFEVVVSVTMGKSDGSTLLHTIQTWKLRRL